MLVQLRELKIRTLGPFLILLTCQRFSDHTPLPSYLGLGFFPPPFVFCLQLWKIRIQAVKPLHNKCAFRDGMHVSLKETQACFLNYFIKSYLAWAQILSISWRTFFNPQSFILMNNYLQKINPGSCCGHLAPFTGCGRSVKLGLDLTWNLGILHLLQVLLNPSVSGQDAGLDHGCGLAIPWWCQDFSDEEAAEAVIQHWLISGLIPRAVWIHLTSSIPSNLDLPWWWLNWHRRLPLLGI